MRDPYTDERACDSGAASLRRTGLMTRSLVERLSASMTARRGQVVRHDQVEAKMVGGLAWRDLRPHRQAMRIDAEVDLGREATPRTAETLPWSPPFAPAA